MPVDTFPCPTCRTECERRYGPIHYGTLAMRYYGCRSCREFFSTLANDGGDPFSLPDNFKRVEIVVHRTPVEHRGPTAAVSKLDDLRCPYCHNAGRVVQTNLHHESDLGEPEKWRRHRCRGCRQIYYSCVRGDGEHEQSYVQKQCPVGVFSISKAQREAQRKAVRRAASESGIHNGRGLDDHVARTMSRIDEISEAKARKRARSHHQTLDPSDDLPSELPQEVSEPDGNQISFDEELARVKESIAREFADDTNHDMASDDDTYDPFEDIDTLEDIDGLED